MESAWKNGATAKENIEVFSRRFYKLPDKIELPKQELEKERIEAEKKIVKAEAENRANELKQQNLTDNIIKENTKLKERIIFLGSKSKEETFVDINTIDTEQ